MKTLWQVKHGQKLYSFKTLREAREHARLLNTMLGHDFTIISKVNTAAKNASAAV